MHNLNHYFSSVGFSDADVARITSYFKPAKLSKGDHFATEGKVNANLAFINKGAFQYCFNQDGEEITTYVVGQYGFLASLLGVLQQKPSQENIRAITDAELFIIRIQDFNKLKTEVEGFKDFYIALLEYQIICVDESRFALLTQSAEERYQNILKKQPELLQQIPLYFLATILGVTPRHLSRIRSKIK